MTYRANKKGNDYQHAMGAQFDDTPKAVLGAVAMSWAILLSESNDDRDLRMKILDEWEKLHLAEVVPQPVPAKYANELAEYRREQAELSTGRIL